MCGYFFMLHWFDFIFNLKTTLWCMRLLCLNILLKIKIHTRMYFWAQQMIYKMSCPHTILQTSSRFGYVHSSLDSTASVELLFAVSDYGTAWERVGWVVHHTPARCTACLWTEQSASYLVTHMLERHVEVQYSKVLHSHLLNWMELFFLFSVSLGQKLHPRLFP